MADDSFKDFVLDQLDRVGEIRARKMFGGYGLYCGDVFFGIISNGVLYFKTNEETKKRYVDAGMDCFRPSEEQVLKNYFEVPADVLENMEEVSGWAEEAIGVGRG